MKRINCAVIGGKGYIGKHLSYYLKNKGYDVFVYDVMPDKEDGYQCLDMVDPKSVSAIDLDIDYVFMFAGLTGTYAGFDAFDKYINAEHYPHMVGKGLYKLEKEDKEA